MRTNRQIYGVLAKLKRDPNGSQTNLAPARLSSRVRLE
jgi:hypothetical protein